MRHTKQLHAQLVHLVRCHHSSLRVSLLSVACVVGVFVAVAGGGGDSAAATTMLPQNRGHDDSLQAVSLHGQ